MGLTTLLNLFDKSHAHIAEASYDKMANDFYILEQHLPYIFPREREVAPLLKRIKKGNQDHDALAVESLPFHTRDYMWMTEYVTHMMDELAPTKKVDPYNIKMFVRLSPKYDVTVYRFEQDMVKAQILLTLFSARQSGMVETKNYDRVFRTAVVNELAHYGLDRHAAEIGLELNAKLWREQTMLQAFNNQYYRHPGFNNNQTRPMHQETWARLREYQYYQEHKDVIDQLGTATENMKIPHEQAQKLNQQARHYERIHNELETYYQHNHAYDQTVEKD